MITVKSTNEKKEIECNFCHTTLEYESSDVHDIYEGYGFTCPKCGNGIVVEEIPTDKPIYPKNFFKFGNGAKIENKEIQEWCDKIFKTLKESKKSFDYRAIGSGDTTVIGTKYEDGEIDIVVAKNYEDFSWFPED